MQKVYETNRLIITKFIVSDVTQVADMFEDEILSQLSGLNLPPNRSEKLIALTMMADNKTSQIYVIRNKNQRQIIGLVVFYRMYLLNYMYSEFDCELGFVLDRESWGKGIMSEAVKILLLGYFDETDFVGVYAGAHFENEKSISLLERMGFKSKTVPANFAEEQFDQQLEYFYLSQSMFGCS